MRKEITDFIYIYNFILVELFSCPVLEKNENTSSHSCFRFYFIYLFIFHADIEPSNALGTISVFVAAEGKGCDVV